jgi:hypothetical protein
MSGRPTGLTRDAGWQIGLRRPAPDRAGLAIPAQSPPRRTVARVRRRARADQGGALPNPRRHDRRDAQHPRPRPHPAQSGGRRTGATTARSRWVTWQCAVQVVRRVKGLAPLDRKRGVRALDRLCRLVLVGRIDRIGWFHPLDRLRRVDSLSPVGGLADVRAVGRQARGAARPAGGRQAADRQRCAADRSRRRARRPRALALGSHRARTGVCTSLR